MTWPIDNITFEHYDEGTDKPNRAREELIVLGRAVQDIIQSRGLEGGVVPLDSQGEIPFPLFPNVISSDVVFNQGIRVDTVLTVQDAPTGAPTVTMSPPVSNFYARMEMYLQGPFSSLNFRTGLSSGTDVTLRLNGSIIGGTGASSTYYYARLNGGNNQALASLVNGTGVSSLNISII